MSNEKRRIDGISIEIAGDINPTSKESTGVKVKRLMIRKSLLDLTLEKKDTLKNVLDSLVDDTDTISRSELNREFRALGIRAIKYFKDVSILEDDIRKTHVISYANDVVLLAKVSEINPESFMWDVRCKDCGKLLYRINDRELNPGIVHIEAHCRDCKKPVATKYGLDLKVKGDIEGLNKALNDVNVQDK